MKHDFDSLVEIYEYSTKKYSKRHATEFADGTSAYTYAEFNDKCRNISKKLSNFGIKSYDKIAILSQNMPNWTIAFFAITVFGRIAVPMLTELTENEINNILVHSDAKAIFVSRRLYSKLTSEMIDRMKLVICLDDFSLLNVKDEAFTCDGTISSPLPDDIAAIIYTSGTTGSAKGVMLSQRNLSAIVNEAWGCHKVRKKDVFLSILPMAHTYEMSIGMLYPFAVGAKVCYIQKPPTPSILLNCMKKVRPSCMLSVPLIIEKIYRNSILPTIEKSKFLRDMRNIFPSILYTIVGIKLKSTFGGRMKFFGIGGAKLDAEVEYFLKKAHFPYSIGYGLTETAPLICGTPPGRTKVGTTGPACKGVQVKLINVDPVTGEGELTVKGDNVMRGYYKDYSRTEDVLSADGWFRTGDLAYVDRQGRYYIKGRIGTVIIGASGENIYPEEIEDVLNNHNEVAESLVVERDGHLIALVHLNDNVLDWNLENENKFAENVEEKANAILEYVNSKVNKNSKIKEVQVQKDPFIKTATHKIKRFLYKNQNHPTA